MNMKRKKSLPIALLTLLAAAVTLLYPIACEETIESDLIDPMTFEVRLTGGDTGSVGNPLPYSDDSITFTFDIRALDSDGGRDTGFNGTVAIDVQPRGKLASTQGRWVEFSKGLAKDVSVAVENVHGKVNIWFEDVDNTDGYNGSYATGLSPTIYVDHPTIRNAQITENIESSPLRGDYIEINTSGRELVVTGLTRDGFFVTDIDEPEGTFNAMYVFSFSRPGDLEQGDRLTQLSGTGDEYYGFTELSFPSWRSAGQTERFPSPVLLGAFDVGDDALMESLEARLIEVDNVYVCPLTEEFETYGQWKVMLTGTSCSGDSGALTVMSNFTASDFDPGKYTDTTIAQIRGHLRYHVAPEPPWILEPRSETDIVTIDTSDLF
jgi:hypothetical protein